MTAKRAPFLSDQPVDLSRDAFDHQDYTDTLVSMVTDDDPPATIGVFGPWGVGKSTILGGIQRNLSDRSHAFVYFDAWRYEGDSLRRQFLLEVAGQLENDPRGSQLKGFKTAKDLRELEVDVQKLEEEFSFSWPRVKRAAVVGLVFGAIAFSAGMLGLFDSLMAGAAFEKRVLSGLIVAAATFLASLLSQTVVVNATTLTRRTLQDPDRFATKFTEMIAALKPERLVVAIDNLDRCAPDKAVQMLATIKTYLEPAVGSQVGPRSLAHHVVAKKEVVFVIAVDDDALRRHLIAEEVDRSGGQVDAIEVRSGVDEYLAKFFSARLPIRDALPSDMRGYVAEHIGPLAVAREMNGPDKTRLIGLISSALRTNPRRVKQFVNDLEARMRLFQERETAKDGKSPGIHPAVSGEITMIAKLALLESEWPDAFEILRREPRRLDEWQAHAEAEREVDWFGDEDRIERGEESENERAPSENLRRKRRRFGDFLRQSRDIDSNHLRALISLKQSRDEVELPGFTEFRAAVVAGDLDAVEGHLADLDEEQRQDFAATLCEIVDEELTQGYLDGARAAVNAAVTLQPLREPESARRDALKRAVEDFRLRKQLALLDPTRVLDVGELLERADQERIFEPFVDRFVDDDTSDDAKRSTAEGLAPYAKYLTTRQQSSISEALAGDLGSKFNIYADLVQANSELLPEGIARAVVEALAVGETPGWAGKTAALSVASLALARESHDDLEQLLIDQFIQVLNANGSDEDALKDEIDAANGILPQLESTAPENWTRLAETIQGQWAHYPRGAHAALIGLLGSILPKASESTQSTVPASIIETAFATPDNGIELAKEVQEWRDPFIERLQTHLISTASVHLATRKDAAAILADLSGEDAPKQLSLLFTSLLEHDSFDAAVELLDEHKVAMRSEVGQLGEVIAGQAVRAIESGSASPGTLLTRTVEYLGASEAAEISAALEGSIRSGHELGLDVTVQLKGVDDADEIRRLAVEPLVIDLANVNPGDPSLRARLRAIAANTDVLDAAQLRTVGEQYVAWIRAYPDQAVVLAQELRNTGGFRAPTSERLVNALVDAERTKPDRGEKLELLFAADHVRGASNTKASKAFASRLEELRSEDDSGRSVADEVDPRGT